VLKDSVEIFDKYADRYDLWYMRNRISAENEVRVLQTLVNQPYNICVEIGGGTGFFSSKFGCMNIDPSISMLQRSRLRGVDNVQGYGEYIPLRDRSIDLVMIVVTICFVDDPRRLLEESARILRRDGRLITCIIPKESSWGKYYMRKRSESPFYSVAHFISREELYEMISGVGLEIIRALGTLSYGPEEEPRLEEPAIDDGRYSFVCAEARKIE